MAIKAYVLKDTGARKVKDEDKSLVAQALDFAKYEGGAIENHKQLMAGLILMPKYEALFREFKGEAKKWVNENGEVEHPENGKYWGPRDYESETKVSMTLKELCDFLLDLRFNESQVGRVSEAMRRRGVGMPKTTTRFSWTK